MKKILVANRGEIASRAIWSFRALGLETVSIYSKEDRGLPFLNNADYAFEIGTGPVGKTYENIDAIIELKDKTDSDAIYIGYGFLYDNITLQKEANLIAPNSEFIKKTKDKESLRILVKNILNKNKIKAVVGEAIFSFEELKEKIKNVKLPVILKPNYGKLSRGLTCIKNAELKETQFYSTKMEAELLGFEGSFILERFMKGYKEISVLVLRDSDGRVTVLPEVDTSINRNFSWLIAESPALISDTTRENIHNFVKELAEYLDLQGLMNVEFFVKGDDIYFNEVNPGLSMWYSVVEQVAQLDLIQEQFNIFSGKSLKHDKVLKPRGNAVMFKILAENPVDFTPSFGKIDDIFIPIMPNLRVEYTAFPSWDLPIHYDNVLGKLSLWASTRKELLNGASYLLEKHLVSGVDTNVSYLSAILASKDFRDASYNVSSFDNVGVSTDRDAEDLLFLVSAVRNLGKNKPFNLRREHSAWNMDNMLK